MYNYACVDCTRYSGMGNTGLHTAGVHAAGPSTAESEAGIPPPPPLTAPPPSSNATSGQAAKSSDDEERKGKIQNPGPYDDVHRKAKGQFNQQTLTNE